MKLTYLKNCGLLVETGKKKLLIDALNMSTENFDGLTGKEFTDMFFDNSPCYGADYVIVTHNHLDHNDKEMAEEYLDANIKCRYIEPEGNGGKEQAIKDGDIEINTFNTVHSGSPEEGLMHWSVLVKDEKHSIFVAGDADSLSDELIEKLKNEKLEAIFTMPFFIGGQKGVDALKNIGAKHNYIYHIPEEGKDPWSIRPLAKNLFNRYGKEVPNLELLLNNMYEFIVL
ncbi:MAG: MBL fold metallo-hydrolase [Clostridium sp.]|nr:MBL fold metallo-hydrolase [Clostridium sp.]